MYLALIGAGQAVHGAVEPLGEVVAHSRDVAPRARYRCEQRILDVAVDLELRHQFLELIHARQRLSGIERAEQRRREILWVYIGGPWAAEKLEESAEQRRP